MPGKAWKTRKKREEKGKYLFVINFVKRAMCKNRTIYQHHFLRIYAQF